MVGVLQPLSSYFSICDEKGLPTDYFIRWCQQRQIDIGEGITAAEAQALIDASILSALTAHKVQAGTGITLSPADGELIHDPTISADIQALLNTISTTRGTVLYRGASAWSALSPGTAGQVLTTGGAGADPSWAAVGGGGGTSTLGELTGQLITQTTPAVNFYVMKWLVAPASFTMNKIAFVTSSATPTTTYRPFVYASTAAAGSGGALLSAGPQVTGAVAGYNEAVLSSPVVLVKGQPILVGISTTTAAIANLWTGPGLAGFASNGGSNTPAATCPAITFVSTYGQVYGFWGVA